MKKLVALLLAICVVLSLAACAAKTETAAPAAEKKEEAAASAPAAAEKTEEPAKELKFAWLNPTIGNPVYVLYDEGVKMAAADYGVTVDILGTTTSDPDGYAQQIEIAIANGYDGIITYPYSSGAMMSAIKKAKDAGIPVIDVVMDSTYEDTYYGLDVNEMGKMLADSIAEACGSKGKLLYTQTNFEIELQNQIREACYARLAEAYPDMEFVANDQLTVDSVKQAEVYTNLFTAHPDVVGLVVCDATGGPNGARIAKEFGIEGFKVACIDDTEDTLAMIRSDDVYSTIAQGAQGMMYDAVRLLYEHCTEGKTLPEFVGIPMITVTKDNTESYVEEMNNNAHFKGTPWDY